jgi:hypothetical protein
MLAVIRSRMMMMLKKVVVKTRSWWKTTTMGLWKSDGGGDAWR